MDDEVAHLQALEGAIGGLHYEVSCHASPLAALEMLARHPFDVLLSDLRMPEMDGIELMRRAMAIDPDLVPVLMTGYSSIDSAVEAMKVGALDYILKPFRIGTLRPVLERALQMRRLRQDNRRLSEQLERRARQLEAANAELDSFAARVAHDLRAPLNIVVGFAGALAESATERLQERERIFLQRVEDAGRRADRMVTGLLSFARLGDGPLLRDPVDLGLVVQRARSALVMPGDERVEAVDWQIAPLPKVRGDAVLLEQVFTNLLSNALKFMRGVEAPRVEIAAERVDGGVEVFVRDSGIGFDAARANMLFTPFVRLHDPRQFEGTGMGLANVRRIMERHGGSVSAISAPGQGASFRLRFADDMPQ
ncbi:ATP-binding protein [Roseateles sp.]|uniref:ATP-binding protein n=1 Tax=Roseateles sp. TaxID=1971397 RepID=UPI0025F6D34B|nr:ATP-binding protein [Roseateles sp.]MBV8035901.1 response regulator [Roseateles sp.]